jgi:hypothetical protein
MREEEKPKDLQHLVEPEIVTELEKVKKPHSLINWANSPKKQMPSKVIINEVSEGESISKTSQLIEEKMEPIKEAKIFQEEGAIYHSRKQIHEIITPESSDHQQERKPPKTQELIPRRNEKHSLRSFNPQSLIDQKQEMYLQVRKSMKEIGIHEIPLDKFKDLSKDIEILGCKIINCSPSKCAIILFPFKIMSVKESVLVSDIAISFVNSRESVNGYSILDAHAKRLLKARDAIFQQFIRQKSLFTMINQSLGLNATLKTNFRKQPLYMVSENVQYEIITEPIIICDKDVSSIDNNIIFPYQRRTNLHVISTSNMGDLLDYLNQKHFFLTRSRSTYNPIMTHHKSSIGLYKQVQLVSLPFFVYGIGLLLALLLQIPDIVRMLIALSSPLGITYGIAILYAFFRFFRRTKHLSSDFMKSHHLKSLDLVEEDLILLNQEFSTEWMYQLSHEFFYKKLKSPTLESIVIQTLENNSIKSSPSIECDDIYEDVAEREDFAVNREISREQKYRNFLED